MLRLCVENRLAYRHLSQDSQVPHAFPQDLVYIVETFHDCMKHSEVLDSNIGHLILKLVETWKLEASMSILDSAEYINFALTQDNSSLAEFCRIYRKVNGIGTVLLTCKNNLTGSLKVLIWA